MRPFGIFVLLIVLLFMGNSCSYSKEKKHAKGQEPLALSGKTRSTNKDNSGVEGIDYKAGEVLVKFKSHVADMRREQITGLLELETIRIISPLNVYLLKIRSHSPVRDIIEHLQQFEEVEYAEPNYIRKAY